MKKLLMAVAILIPAFISTPASAEDEFQCAPFVSATSTEVVGTQRHFKVRVDFQQAHCGDFIYGIGELHDGSGYRGVVEYIGAGATTTHAYLYTDSTVLCTTSGTLKEFWGDNVSVQFSGAGTISNLSPGTHSMLGCT